VIGEILIAGHALIVQTARRVYQPAAGCAPA
jgi:hypothetical protein